jgi:hypothetical protein
LSEGTYDKIFGTNAGLKDVRSLELIDFQCNDLTDKHSLTISKLIGA